MIVNKKLTFIVKNRMADDFLWNRHWYFNAENGLFMPHCYKNGVEQPI